MVVGIRLPSGGGLVNIQRRHETMSRRYGPHQTEVQVDCEWATLDVVIHWSLDCDDYQEHLTIDKITVGDRDLHEGWNVAYFEDIINDEVLAGADYHWTDHGD